MYIVYDRTLEKEVSEPIGDYKVALSAALKYSETNKGHVVNVRQK